MKHTKLCLIAAVIALAASNVGSMFAQTSTITFAYDPAGNRTARTIIMNSSAPQNAPRPQQNTDEQAQEQEKPFVEQLTADVQVRIYPNPTEGFLQVELAGIKEGETAQIAVFDTGGRPLFRTDGVRSISTVNLSDVPAGMYLLRLTLRGRAETYQIIKK